MFTGKLEHEKNLFSLPGTKPCQQHNFSIHSTDWVNKAATTITIVLVLQLLLELIGATDSSIDDNNGNSNSNNCFPKYI
jgi:hypothetical protein